MGQARRRKDLGQYPEQTPKPKNSARLKSIFGGFGNGRVPQKLIEFMDDYPKLPEMPSYQDSPKLINTWSELAQFAGESETHTLKVDDHSGWIHSKTNQRDFHYLSTHTFYGSNHTYSTELLQRCGFNVTLANWDE